MFSNYKYFSIGVSIILHIILFTFLLANYQRTNNNPNASLVEIGFGGEPGGGGGGTPDMVKANPEEKIPTKEPVEKKTKAVEKPKGKEVEGTSITKVVPGTGNGTGTGTGTGNGTGSGTGTGIGIPKPKVEPPKPVSEVYLVAVEQMPEALGGIEGIKDKIPPSVRGGGLKGTVYVLAYIDENGTVRKVLLSKGIGGDADQSALQAVRRTHFKAGRKAGVPVKVQMLVAIMF